MSGDVNPAHVDEEFARSDMFHKVIAHGMWGAALISTVLGTELPGPGTIYLGQTLSFRRPVVIGDIVTVTVRVIERNEEKGRVTFDCQCANQRGETVISGTAFFTAREDIMNYVPFPGILPLVSAGYKNLAVQGTYVPGRRGTGNVAFFWAQYTF